MVKQFLKIAGVRSEKEFYNKYPTKESFFKAHPDAEMLDMAMYGGAYEGGGNVEDARRLRAANLRKQIPSSQPEEFRPGVMGMRGKGGLTDMYYTLDSGEQNQMMDRVLLNQMERSVMDDANKAAKKIAEQNMREINYRNKLDMLNKSFNPFTMDRYQMGGGMEQQAAAQGGGDQQEQIIQFVAQALQQGADPQEIMQQLVEAGVPQEQAGQLIQAVAEQLQQMAAQPQQGQQPMMRMGGAPCYQCGGKMKKGGSAYSGTYSAGVYYEGGGSYVPTYADMAYNPYGVMFADGGSFDNPGFRALPPQVQAKIMSSSKKMVGGDLKVGGEYEMSQAEVDDLIKKGYKIKYVK